MAASSWAIAVTSSTACPASGYQRAEWDLLQAADYGVPQLRPRALLVALRDDVDGDWRWPDPDPDDAPTVGEALEDLMAARGWPHAQAWAARANRVAPTLVGGSKKHGGPDLGPTRAKREWAAMGCSGMGIANEAPGPDEIADHAPRHGGPHDRAPAGIPGRLGVRGPQDRPVPADRRRLPPPVARAVGARIAAALGAGRRAIAA